MNKIQRALISVYDKTGVAAFAKALDEMRIEIISTGGTAELLRKEGIAVRDVSDVTKFPEMLSGRVKTLHPALHAGLLALRDDSKHLATLAEHNIKPIDLVVVNLYPFWDAVKNKADEREIIEMIDIGGPSMLRSAAKNFRFVASVPDPADYARVLEELKKNDRVLSDATRRELAAKVFRLTSAYDGLIQDYFSNPLASSGRSGAHFPQTLKLDFEKSGDLRYGENPHQAAALYREAGRADGVLGARKLNGKELSFNNILDLDAAWEIVRSFPPKADPPLAGDQVACAIIKHTNPCGFALGKDPQEAFKKAYACDPLSAFGGIIGFNDVVDAKTAAQILKSGFMECVIAVDFDKQALEALKEKKNLRLLAAGRSKSAPSPDFKKVTGGLLLQDSDTREIAPADLKCVTKTAPSKSETADLLFAFKVCRFVKSNAIVVAKAGATLGLGMGLTSRVDSCDTAFRKAGKRAKGAVLASDGFFPKPDSIQLAKKHGIRAIIQPGGSIQDEAVVAAADKAGIRMVFTGVRHFRH
jgi:phosphoribosylaminoimidazolecarboxamide formyltransferase / IMP cyclohydrolase